jgi:uncharacterized metal-binding protein
VALTGDGMVKGGRPPLDPAGKAIKTSGVWLGSHDHERLMEVIQRIMVLQGCTSAAARRRVLLSGVRAELARLAAHAEVTREVKECS